MRLFALLMLLVGCPTEPPEPDYEPTLTNLQTELFSESCAFSSCHGGNDPEVGLDLSSAGLSWQTSVNVDGEEASMVRVVPGNANDSLMYQALLDDVEGVRQMPIGEEIAPEDIEAVRLWIEAGALDD